MRTGGVVSDWAAAESPAEMESRSSPNSIAMAEIRNRRMFSISRRSDYDYAITEMGVVPHDVV